MPVVVDHSGFGHKDRPLEIHRDTDLLLSTVVNDVKVSMPFSRRTRQIYTSSSPPTEWWPKIVAEVYRANRVGQFAGDFDKSITSNIRAGNTVLTFEEFVSFRHAADETCCIYDVNLDTYKELDTISKIKSLTLAEVQTEEYHLSGPASLRTGKHELSRIVYTCFKKGCIFPCLCALCNVVEATECQDHKILHPGFFNPKKHLFTVRNADTYDINWNSDYLFEGNKYCTNRKCIGSVESLTLFQRWRRRSCLKVDQKSCLCPDCPSCKSVDVFKYAGIEKECPPCATELLEHEAYHLVYHFMCKFCRSGFGGRSSIKTEKDYWEILENRRFEEAKSCHYCNKFFYNSTNKKRHVEIVHEENPDVLFSCEQCERAFGSKQALKYHGEIIHDEIDLEVSCKICEKLFKTSHNLDVHVREVHGIERYECDLCSSTFSRQSNLNHHYEVVHDTRINHYYANDDPDVIEYYKCELCDHKTREKRTLAHHVKVIHHKDEQPILSCDRCNFETIEKKTLTHHKVTVHEKSSLKLLYCSLCEFSTAELKTLNHHFKISHGKKDNPTFYCQECNFTTQERKTLTHHVKHVHKKQSLRVLLCDKCDFKTTEYKTLKHHAETVHAKTGRPVFSCDICNFSTIAKKTLTHHKNIVHNPNKKRLLSCEECDFRTSEVKYLNRHVRTAHRNDS